MSRIRFYNARILTMKDKEITEGELWTDGSAIEYIGAGKPSDRAFDREIDCKGNLLMPGFKNAHTHTAMTFARSLADSANLHDWLYDHIFPIEARLKDEHIYWLSKIGYAEYLAGGITACFDMYFNKEAQARCATDTGIRHVFCGSVNDFGGIDKLEDEFIRFNDYGDLISYKLGFHAEYTTSMENMKIINDIVHKFEAPLFVHISETKAEVDGCRERYGMSPVKLLSEMGMYDFGGGGFHCVWFDDEDMEIFRNRGLWSVFNPCSNLKLASGAAGFKDFIDNGMNIALGTDGAGSNNSLNIFREMFLAACLPNLKVEGGAFVDPFTILKAATTGGALCMGLTDSDVLDEGKNADIIMIDMSNPTMNPVNDIVANLVFSGHPGIVKMTMIAGKILYENGEYKTIDLDEADRMSNKLLGELL
ncbi:5-methylthioadenosine/S-adenosylhomocysteine deaminase [Ruminococcaceae bacterium YRB3002]|nr:5-methylthioadenosine/S-adenosylhomocysteine deaminase [Ruminococcaceae bacterium YRB3002]